MKKTLLFLLICLSTVAHGQSRLYIGGGVGLKSSKYSFDDYSGTESTIKLRGFELSPSFNYMVTKNLYIGIGLSYGWSQYKNKINWNSFDDYFHKEKLSSFGVVPQVTYLIRLSDKFYYTPHVYAYMGRDKMFRRSQNFTYLPSEDGSYLWDYYIVEYTAKYSTLSTGVRILSFEFRPHTKIGLNLSCGRIEYERNRQSDDNRRRTVNHNFYWNLNENLELTFKYYFR